MTFVDSGKGSVSREGGRIEEKIVAVPIQAGRQWWIMPLCAKAFSFTL